MQKNIILVVIVVVVLIVGFFGWQYISFGKSKTACLDRIKGEIIESDVTFNFSKGVDFSGVELLAEFSREIPGVLDLKVQSEEEVYKEFAEKHKDDASIVQSLKMIGEDNPIGPKIELHIKDFAEVGSRAIDDVEDESHRLGLFGYANDYNEFRGWKAVYNLVQNRSFDLAGNSDSSKIFKSCAQDGYKGIANLLLRSE